MMMLLQRIQIEHQERILTTPCYLHVRSPLITSAFDTETFTFFAAVMPQVMIVAATDEEDRKQLFLHGCANTWALFLHVAGGGSV
jgi:hypothetical protein